MISAIVLTKNEEENIVDCLLTLTWCDEIIVIDDESQDRTVDIINNLKIEKINVFTRPLENNFAAQRNFGLQKASGEWVLFIDADERVSQALASEMKNLMLQGFKDYNGFYVRRRDFIWGKELRFGETGNIKLLRLAKRGAGIWKGHVHERWEVKGIVGELKNPLNHYPHQTISEFLQEINFYTDLRAKELFHKKVKSHWWSIIAHPKAKFFVNYFIKRGFLDGLPGLIFAILMSFHSFLVRGKLWLLQNKK